MRENFTAITMDPYPAELDTVFAEIDQFADQQDWPDDLIFQIRLIVEELAMNVINYGNRDGTEPIELRLATKEETIVLEISDVGKPFDPLTEAPAPDLSSPLEDRPIGGLGLFLVKTLMDEVHYQWEDGRNHLRLITRIRA